MAKKSNKVILHTSKTMIQPNKPASAPAPYPDKTSGSAAAADIRKKANGLTDEERENLFKKGMQIIYGGNGTKEALRAR